MVKNFTAKIEKKSNLAEDTFGLRIRLNSGDILDFQPGQFVNILVAPNVRRSYSIGSSSVHNGYIDLYGDTVAGGPGSEFFRHASVGDEVSFLGPLGSFIYQEDSRPAYFFSTGTGVVPFMSMISYALETLQTKRPITLYQGFRFAEGIFADEYFSALAAKYPNFKYILTLSKPGPNWHGNSGRITDYYTRDLQTVDKDICAYVCGSKNVIVDVQSRLTEMGVPGNQVYFEQFY